MPNGCWTDQPSTPVCWTDGQLPSGKCVFYVAWKRWLQMKCLTTFHQVQNYNTKYFFFSWYHFPLILWCIESTTRNLQGSCASYIPSVSLDNAQSWLINVGNAQRNQWYVSRWDLLQEHNTWFYTSRNLTVTWTTCCQIMPKLMILYWLSAKIKAKYNDLHKIPIYVRKGISNVIISVHYTPHSN